MGRFLSESTHLIEPAESRREVNNERLIDAKTMRTANVNTFPPGLIGDSHRGDILACSFTLRKARLYKQPKKWPSIFTWLLENEKFSNLFVQLICADFGSRSVQIGRLCAADRSQTDNDDPLNHWSVSVVRSGVRLDSHRAIALTRVI